MSTPHQSTAVTVRDRVLALALETNEFLTGSESFPEIGAAMALANETAFGGAEQQVWPARARGHDSELAAIAVMIMAFLGAAMWLAFKGIFDDASKSTSQQVSEIGK